jgi:hypothetical protein
MRLGLTMAFFVIKNKTNQHKNNNMEIEKENAK